MGRSLCSGLITWELRLPFFAPMILKPVMSGRVGLVGVVGVRADRLETILIPSVLIISIHRLQISTDTLFNSKGE